VTVWLVGIVPIPAKAWRGGDMHAFPKPWRSESTWKRRRRGNGGSRPRWGGLRQAAAEGKPAIPTSHLADWRRGWHGEVGKVMAETETSAEVGPWSTAASNGTAALLQQPLRLLQL
jgi:hypothetical protein